MITITGNILENRYTTAQWAAITTPLPDRVWGHEVDSSGNPIGSKMGDGIKLWAVLSYWYASDTAEYETVIAKGTPIPFNIVLNTPKRPFVSFLIAKFNDSSGLILTSNGTSGMTYNPRYTTSGKTLLASIDVFGNDDGAGLFNEDTWIRIF